MARSPTSFRLSDTALAALDRMRHSQGLTRTQAVEYLILGEISPRRVNENDLGRRQLPRHIEEIRELIRLTRSLGDLASNSARHEDDLRSLVSFAFEVIESIDAEHRAARCRVTQNSSNAEITTPGM